ncbi:hypothetical protein [Galactobacillus timonensis]|nr:hypothetical protein [Galactobacillus timonensis]MDD6369470.1 hypothetical protein [Galactobacillus timonensis]
MIILGAVVALMMAAVMAGGMVQPLYIFSVFAGLMKKPLSD